MALHIQYIQPDNDGTTVTVHSAKALGSPSNPQAYWEAALESIYAVYGYGIAEALPRTYSNPIPAGSGIMLRAVVHEVADQSVPVGSILLLWEQGD